MVEETRPNGGHDVCPTSRRREYRVTRVWSTAPSQHLLAQHVGDLVVSLQSYTLRGRSSAKIGPDPRPLALWYQQHVPAESF